MKVTLKNSHYEVVINTLGAEINSFRDVVTGTKYVFEGPETIWKFHAPILFPHVGKILDGYMTVGEKQYHLGNNGMSRDLEHKLIENTDTTATFELTESEATKDKYPWKFSLKTHYELRDDGLTFTTTVTNTDSETISFSLGSHTAFCCPRNTDPEGTTNADYQYEFEKKEALTQVLTDENGYLLSDEEGTTPATKLYGEKEAGIVPINEKGFGAGHFFTKITSDWVGLRNKKDGSLVKVNTKGYPYVMLWQNAGKPAFNCIEPWYGTADSLNTDHAWENKISLITLESGKSFTADQSITIEK
ncbi:MAG: aldose 1-epimerase family protein [Treponemataceae bacterium]|nr:aldose 1-epimerase family protein [Treponemataceae bacterium]